MDDLELAWWAEDEHYEMPGGYAKTPAERLDALYDEGADVPSASALAARGIRVSTHGRVEVSGKVLRGTRRGSGWRVTIDGQKMCVAKLVKRVWLTSPHTTDLKFELWNEIDVG